MVLRELRRDIPGGCVQGAMVRDWLTSDICSLGVDASPQFLGLGKEIDGAQAASALGCLLSWAGSELLFPVTFLPSSKTLSSLSKVSEA